MKALFIVTHNIAGYCPEAAPVVFETFADAKGYTVEEMRAGAESVEPDTPCPFGEVYAADLMAEADELERIPDDAPGGSWGVYVITGSQPEHLPQSWDITKTYVSDEEAAELMGEMA